MNALRIFQGKFACSNLLRQKLRIRAHENFSIHKMKFDKVQGTMVERCAVSHLLVYVITYKYKTRLKRCFRILERNSSGTFEHLRRESAVRQLCCKPV